MGRGAGRYGPAYPAAEPGVARGPHRYGLPEPRAAGTGHHEPAADAFRVRRSGQHAAGRGAPAGMAAGGVRARSDGRSVPTGAALRLVGYDINLRVAEDARWLR